MPWAVKEPRETAVAPFYPPAANLTTE